MSNLSNENILEEIELGNLKVQGMNHETIRENGLDLRIDDVYARENPEYMEKTVDIHNQDPERFQKVDVSLGGFIIINSGEFVLLSTKEFIEFPNDIMGSCNIRSTVARTGLMCPPTIVDAGFRGNLTIEIYNTTKKDIIIHVGDRFLHVVLSYLKTPCSIPYQGKYQDQKKVTVPKASIL